MYYVYNFLNENDEVIYVGYTNNLIYRMKQHFGKGGHLNQQCYSITSKIRYSVFQQMVEAKFVEASLISNLKPKYNINFINTDIMPLGRDIIWNTIDKSSLNNIQEYILDNLGKVINLSEMPVATRCVNRLTKNVVDSMLAESENTGVVDVDMLYSWCKITNNINSQGQVKLLGSYIDNATNKKLLEDVMLTGYTMRLVDIAHSFSCVLMKNREVAIKNWTELYEMIDIPLTNKRHQQKLKKFLENNNIVRAMKVKDMNGNNITKFILNPFLFRKSSHLSPEAISLFQEYIEEGINMSSYSVRWLIETRFINKHNGGIE